MKKLAVLFIVAVLVAAAAVPAAAQTPVRCAPGTREVPRVDSGGTYISCEPAAPPQLPPPPFQTPTVVVQQQSAVVYQPVPMQPMCAWGYAPVWMYGYWGCQPHFQAFPVFAPAPCWGSCVSVSIGATFPIGGGHHHRHR